MAFADGWERGWYLKPFTSEESLKFNGTSLEVRGINVKTRPKLSLGRQEMVEAERHGWVYLFFIYIDHMGRKSTQKKRTQVILDGSSSVFTL